MVSEIHVFIFCARAQPHGGEISLMIARFSHEPRWPDKSIDMRQAGDQAGNSSSMLRVSVQISGVPGPAQA